MLLPIVFSEEDQTRIIFLHPGGKQCLFYTNIQSKVWNKIY